MAKKTSVKVPYIFAVLFTVSGYAISILINLLYPQKAADVAFKSYDIPFLTLNANDLYITVLALLITGFAVSGIIAHRSDITSASYRNKAKLRFAAGLLLGVLDIAGTKEKILPQPFFPGPVEILEPFLSEGDFIAENLFYSLRLYIFGFFFGAFFGIGTGILIGWFDNVHFWVNPILELTGVIPAVAWMPFALTLCPTPFSAAVFLIVICVWFPIASLTAAGIRSTPKALYEAAGILGGKSSFLLFHVAVPHAMPQIFTGLSTANAYAFTTLVMAEMLGQPGGLGYYINLSKVWSSYNKVFTAILIMAVLFSIILKVLKLIESYVLRWQNGVVK